MSVIRHRSSEDPQVRAEIAHEWLIEYLDYCHARNVKPDAKRIMETITRATTDRGAVEALEKIAAVATFAADGAEAVASLARVQAMAEAALTTTGGQSADVAGEREDQQHEQQNDEDRGQ